MKREYLVAAGVLAAAVVGYLAYRKFGHILGTTLNPASDQNAAYTGVNALARGTGLIDNQDTIGTALYGAANTVRGWFGYGDPDPTAPVQTKPRTAYDFGQGGDSGIPYRPGVFTLPDPFNYDLGYILQ